MFKYRESRIFLNSMSQRKLDENPVLEMILAKSTNISKITSLIP